MPIFDGTNVFTIIALPPVLASKTEPYGAVKFAPDPGVHIESVAVLVYESPLVTVAAAEKVVAFLT
ncbi:unnamed protein product [marine sediment metagenome]|uniref:Uncharacterized protein n=1 Tax=marine sediment metagenome TaxID=412755 RepID=X0VDI3_9ZZZZ